MKAFPDESKQLVNHFIGHLGRQHYKRTEGAMSTDFTTAAGTYLHYETFDSSIQMEKIGNAFFLRRDIMQQKFTGHVSIHRQVVESGIIELDQMYNVITDHGRLEHYVLGLTTDSIKIAMPQQPLGVTSAKKLCKPGEYHFEKRCLPWGGSMESLVEPYRDLIAYQCPQWTEIDKKEITLEKGCLFDGAGGCGKTTKSVELIKIVHALGKRYKVLSFTCASCGNLVDRLEPEEASHVSTFSAYFNENKNAGDVIREAAKLEYIFIEEFSAVPQHFMHMLFQVKVLNPNIKIFVAGDKNQCHVREDNWVFYFDCPMFRHLVDYRMCKFEYKPESGRYDPEHNLVMKHFNDNLTIHKSLHNVGWKDTPYHLCRSSAVRNRVNEEQAALWLKKNDDKAMFVVGGKQYVHGMPIISCTNVKKAKISNSNHLWFHYATSQHVVLRQKSNDAISRVTIKQFTGWTEGTPHFRYGFCESVMRTQGLTLHDDYNILEFDSMSGQEAETAQGRFKSTSQIGLEMKDWNKKFEWSRPKPIKFKMKRPELLNALIYELQMSPNEIYRGFTTGTLKKRHAEHKKEPVSFKMRQTDNLESSTIRLLLEFRYIDLAEVREVEKKFIKRVPFHKCMNTQHRPDDPAELNGGKCKLELGEPKPAMPLKRPKVTDRSKYKKNSWQVQCQGVTQYFRFIRDDPISKSKAKQEAESYIDSLGYGTLPEPDPVSFDALESILQVGCMYLCTC
jgi:hypothetical protein